MLPMLLGSINHYLILCPIEYFARCCISCSLLLIGLTHIIQGYAPVGLGGIIITPKFTQWSNRGAWIAKKFPCKIHVSEHWFLKNGTWLASSPATSQSEAMLEKRCWSIWILLCIRAQKYMYISKARHICQHFSSIIAFDNFWHWFFK